jgi:hypothetical protein
LPAGLGRGGISVIQGSRRAQNSGIADSTAIAVRIPVAAASNPAAAMQAGWTILLLTAQAPTTRDRCLSSTAFIRYVANAGLKIPANNNIVGPH